MSKFITVATFMYPHEAYPFKSRLESEGFPVFLKNELTIQTQNFLSTSMNGVELQIIEDDIERAMPLLIDAGLVGDTETKQTLGLSNKKSTNNNTVCPNCGSDNTTINKKPNSWWAAFFLLIGIPLPFYKRELHCFDCYQDAEIEKTSNSA